MSSIFALQISVNNYRAQRKNWYNNRNNPNPIERVKALDSRDRAILWRKSYFETWNKKS